MGSIYALVSPGGSPGTTTAALALALRWPVPAMVAECDPAGGAVLAGALAGHVPAAVGLMEHVIEAGRDPQAAASDLVAQLIPLDTGGACTVLPGLTDPRQAVGLMAAWPAVAMTLAAQQRDVIADCGRLDASDAQPHAVLAAASTVAVVLRPTLRQVWAARPRLEMLAQLLGSADRVVLLVNGPGTHPPREIADALGIEVAAVLPADTRSAAVLSDGAPRRRQFGSGPLMAAAKAAGLALRRHAAAQASAPVSGQFTALGEQR